MRARQGFCPNDDSAHACPRSCADVETRETAVEDLLDFLSGRDVNEAAGDDDNADGAALELDAEPEWDAAKLPKTYREDNMKVLWQGCYYCV